SLAASWSPAPAALALHDALPISLLLFLLLTSARVNRLWLAAPLAGALRGIWVRGLPAFTDITAEPATLPVLLIAGGLTLAVVILDRKSTRLNSSHVKISYAVCRL